MDIMTKAEFWDRHKAQCKAEGQGTYDKIAHFALHREYWGKYVRAFNIKPPMHLVDACRKAIAEGDEHMNSPYTALKSWDDQMPFTGNIHGLREALRENGEAWCLSTNTCLLKEAMRQHIEGLTA